MSDIDDRIDVIYSRVDDDLCAGRFGEVDSDLLALEVEKMTTVEVLAYLSITKAAEDKLPNRARFATRAREHIEREEPAQAAALAGLL